MAATTTISIDMRGASRVAAGTYVYEGPDFTTGWHHHELHQIEYAFTGVAEVETEHGRYVLPAAQAIWIPAGLPHNTTLNRVRSIAVFFDPHTIAGYDDRARVLPASPLLREMMAYAARWPIGRTHDDPRANDFFTALAHVVVEQLDRELPLALPTTDDPIVAAAMTATRERPDLDVDAVCAAIGTSPRTLNRRFRRATGVTWRQYRLNARLLRAMVLLGRPQSTVARAASDVGFESVNSFTRAFTLHVGETPSAYRRRVAG